MALAQKDAIKALHKSMGIGARKPAAPAAVKRQALAAAQVEVLERVLADIRRKARETPAWAMGYNSAATSVELEIAAAKEWGGI